MTTLIEAASNVQQFQGASLTALLASIEHELKNKDQGSLINLYPAVGLNPLLLESALVLKQAAAQVNVLIHAVGILLTLPFILQDGETIEALSLGAGNTGKPYDVETDVRVAEFKFIAWRGGPESIRQNSLFKDFFYLAELESTKKRYLYVLDATYPLKFLNGGRTLASVLTRNEKLRYDFQQRYGERFRVVRDYYEHKKNDVLIEDLARIVPYFSDMTITKAQDERE